MSSSSAEERPSGDTPSGNTPSGNTAEAAPPRALAGELDGPRLDDAQLAQLFALEQHEDAPSCPERQAAGKARSKKTAAKEAKEALRLLKVARTELKRGKTEKAHGLLCRATAWLTAMNRLTRRSAQWRVAKLPKTVTQALLAVP